MLKGENRRAFEIILKRNMQAILSGHDVRIEMRNGRFYVHGYEKDHAVIEGALCRLFGISGWAQTRSLHKTIDAVLAECIIEAKKIKAHGIGSFKIEARRTDKSFPFDSYALRCRGGQAVLDAVEGMKVDVHKPGAVIQIEIREKAYVYS